MKSVILHTRPIPAAGQSVAPESRKLFIPMFLGVFMFMFFCVSLSAQNVHEYGSSLTFMKSSTDNYVVSQATGIDNLFKNLQSTIYIQHGQLKTVGTTVPVKVEVDADAASLGRLRDVNQSYGQVELITIRVSNANDLNNVLHIASLPSFTNLKYVIYICEFNCSASAVDNAFVPDPHKNVAAYYLISIPE
jgi:hypothetical protein